MGEFASRRLIVPEAAADQVATLRTGPPCRRLPKEAHRVADRCASAPTSRTRSHALVLAWVVRAAELIHHPNPDRAPLPSTTPRARWHETGPDAPAPSSQPPR